MALSKSQVGAIAIPVAIAMLIGAWMMATSTRQSANQPKPKREVWCLIGERTIVWPNATIEYAHGFGRIIVTDEKGEKYTFSASNRCGDRPQG